MIEAPMVEVCSTCWGDPRECDHDGVYEWPAARAALCCKHLAIPDVLVGMFTYPVEVTELPDMVERTKAALKRLGVNHEGYAEWWVKIEVEVPEGILDDAKARHED